MTNTIEELIAGLKKLDKNTKVVYNIYTPRDLKAGVQVYYDFHFVELINTLDDEIIKDFTDSYDTEEEEAYWNACKMVAERLTLKQNKKQNKEENEL